MTESTPELANLFLSATSVSQ